MRASRIRLLAGALVLAVCTPSRRRRRTGPDRRLARPPRPARVGLEQAALDKHARLARDRGSSCLAVVRRGKLAGDWNWGTPRTTPREVFSITKSVTSALVGIAQRDGSLSVDDKVARFVPQWRGTASADVTVRNLLSNDWVASGRPSPTTRCWSRRPTARATPSGSPSSTRSARPGPTTTRRSRCSTRASPGHRDADRRFAQERLFGPLGMAHTRMTRDASGRSTNAFFGLQTTCLDLARFGELYLRGGRVGGKRLLPARFVRTSVTSSTTHNAAYGYLWWLNLPGAIRGATDAVDADRSTTRPPHRTARPGRVDADVRGTRAGRSGVDGRPRHRHRRRPPGHQPDRAGRPVLRRGGSRHHRRSTPASRRTASVSRSGVCHNRSPGRAPESSGATTAGARPPRRPAADPSPRRRRDRPRAWTTRCSPAARPVTSTLGTCATSADTSASLRGSLAHADPAKVPVVAVSADNRRQHQLRHGRTAQVAGVLRRDEVGQQVGGWSKPTQPHPGCERLRGAAGWRRAGGDALEAGTSAGHSGALRRSRPR